MDIIPQLVLNSIIAGSIYALIALGFNLIYGATKFFNLSHGVMAAIGGYSVFYFAKQKNLFLFKKQKRGQKTFPFCPRA